MSKPFKEEHTLGECRVSVSCTVPKILMCCVTQRRRRRRRHIRRSGCRRTHLIRWGTHQHFCHVTSLRNQSLLLPRSPAISHINCHLTCNSSYSSIMQKSASRKRNASEPNIPIAFPSFVRRQIDPIYQILIRRNISSPQI